MWFIGVHGRESPILVNFAPPGAQSRMNRTARRCCNVMLLGFCDSHAYHVRTACGCRIGMCGYTSFLKDGHTCFKFILDSGKRIVNTSLLVKCLLILLLNAFTNIMLACYRYSTVFLKRFMDC